MATLKQIRQRIRAAKNIQQITRAMKLVSAARLKRATDRVLEARPYADKMREFMQSLASGGNLPSHPLMEKREVKRILVILITSDRGLAGAYNTSLIRRAADFIKSQTVPVTMITVGKKGTQFFSKRGYSIEESVTVPSSGARLSDAVQVTRKARQMFENGEVDAVYVIYARFFSAIRQTPQVVQLAPIEAPVSEGGVSGDYRFEPDSASLLGALLPRYFQTLVWQSMLESTASEFGARMTAMTSATDNAGKMINSLTLKANRERQAGITKEILEVVGGAEALKS
ncbi:MAG: ATP synthase F1 subunit gamma [Armatimonadetes bacterium]|jgi:F-type H+-transporting ATPase subunit gamma|nr:ATP synthase F1 subunit gamma [Armatimonadota bacterium]